MSRLLPRKLAVLLGFAIGASALSCGRDVTGPKGGSGLRAAFAFAPIFPSILTQTNSGGGSLVAFNRVRVVLRRTDGAVALDTTVDFPPGATEITVALDVRLAASAPASGEPLEISLGYLNAAGEVVFRGGPATVNAIQQVAGQGPPTPVEIPVRYTGPGADAARVVISPRSRTVLEGDGFTFTAVATDAGGTTIPGTPIIWASLDPARATITSPRAGAGAALSSRGTARIVAQLLTGPTDAVNVEVLLRAAAIAAQSGDAQSATVGTLLPQPLVAKVSASDGVGVGGVNVSFAVASGGGSVATASAVTDASGVAQTTWTLGSIVGAQTVTASAAGLSGSPVTFGATGTAAIPIRVVLTTQPASTTAGATLAPIVLTVRDAQSITTTAFTGPVSVTLGANPGGATLGGTTTVNAVAGVATFSTLTVNRVGTGYTLVASSPGLVGATTTAFDIAAGAARRLEFGAYPVAGAIAGVTIDPISVLARDSTGNLATTFTGVLTLGLGASPAGAAIAGGTTATAANGVGSFESVRLTRAGQYRFTASAAGLTSATGPLFEVGPGPAAGFTLVSGGGQTAAGLSLLPQPIVVQVIDAFGNAVVGAGRTVTFAAATGGGSVSPASTLTNASGQASTAWTLGASVGAQSITASSAGFATLGIGATATATATSMAVSAGPDHSCVVRANGTISCWGANTSGQLGDNTTTARLQPTPVVTGVSFASVSAGGTNHTCALTAGGIAYCWGNNSSGQLGNGSFASALTPVAVTGGLLFAKIIAGAGFSCGFTTVGVGYCWGGGGFRLGNGTNSTVSTPTAVAGGLTFTAMTLFGDNHVCAAATGGTPYCWGYNFDGEIGDNTSTDRPVPTAVAGGLKFPNVASGWFHSCGLTTAGAAYCWGDNNVWQLGWGTPPTDAYSPGAVLGGNIFTTLSAGYAHTCGLRSTGVALCWGINSDGNLGDGTTAWQLTPVSVVGGLLFSQLSAGDGYTCGITSASALYCWGRNTVGQLGDGTTTMRLTPVNVPLP